MAWTAPMTAVANAVFTAAQFNTHVRDNLNETAPAKATTASRIIVTTGANSVTERAVIRDTIGTAESTASTSYTDLTTVGPTLTATTGANVLVFWTATMQTNTANAACFMSFDISGATTQASNDTWSLTVRPTTTGVNEKYGAVYYFPVTAGSNTFTAKYKVSAGTGTFTNRMIFIISL